MSHISTVSRYAFGAGVVAVVVLSVLPGKELPSLGISDKIEHVVAYTTLGLAGGLAFPTRRGALLLLVLLPLMGIGLEIAQLAVPQRSSDIADALADLAGASMVLLPVVFVRFGWCATR
jgi:VanZ family protein